VFAGWVVSAREEGAVATGARGWDREMLPARELLVERGIFVGPKSPVS